MSAKNESSNNSHMKPKEGEMSEFAKRLSTSEETEPLIARNGSTEIRENLKNSQKLSFSLGHVINDILGVLWFSYVLVFLQIVAHLPAITSAFLLFLGQITDAIVTPIIGVLIDKFNNKKYWNAAGVILVTGSFPFIFHIWRFSLWLTVLCYICAITIFQIGWATVQISHLSLIPEMTVHLQERAELTALRYTTHVCSNIVTYIIAYFILQESKTDDLVEPEDGWKFQLLAIVAVSIGCLCSVVFQYRLTATESQNKRKESRLKMQTWQKITHLCCSWKLYVIALIYTTSRLFQSLTLTYIPFFINETNITNSGILAMAPFFNFMAALVSSFGVNFLLKKLYSNKTIFTIGIFFSLFSCMFVYKNADQLDSADYIYMASVFCGIGSTMTVIASLCITANFIGSDTDSGAFIYSFITFADKIITGLVIFFIESLKSSNVVNYRHYYKFILTFLNGVLTLFGYAFVLLLPSSICSSKS